MRVSFNHVLFVVVIAALLALPVTGFQFIDRIVRPCAAGIVPLASVKVNPLNTGNIDVTPCTGGGLTVNGVAIGFGTVTSVSVVTANGFSGSVATATTTPAITINNPTALVATTSITDNGLTAGRVIFAGTSGLLSDDPDLTFAVDTLTSTKFGATTLTGTIAGGGNQINNVIIGTVTPLAGFFTTLNATGNLTVGGTQNAFGAANTTAVLNISTALTGSTNAAGVRIVSALTPATGNDVFGINSSPTAGSGAENITNATAFKAGAVVKGNAGTLTNVYGLLIDGQTASSTNAYGLYVNAPAGGSSLNIAGFFNGSMSAASYLTGTNCADSAGAAACGSAAAGSFVIDAASTATVVSTTAVTANSQIFVEEDSSLGTRLGVTCNTQSSLVIGSGRVTARTAGASFTVTLELGPTTNPACFNYHIVN